ncbi:hypothetical protein ACFL35_08555 [Candidatus Riflebacteria bacterium]
MSRLLLFLFYILLFHTLLEARDVKWSENRYYRTKTIHEDGKLSYQAHWLIVDGSKLNKTEKMFYDLKLQMEELKAENNYLRSRIDSLVEERKTEGDGKSRPSGKTEELDELEKELHRASSDTTASSISTAAPASLGGDSAYNPDIGAVGIINYTVANLDHDEGGPEKGNTFQFEEAELNISGFVDPYHKYDLVLGYHGDEVHIEEGYLSFFNLPRGIAGRVGKFNTSLGFYNQHHVDELPWAGQNFLHESYLGDHSLTTTGFELKKTLKTSGRWTPTLSFEMGSGVDHTVSEGEEHEHEHEANIRAAHVHGNALNPHLGNSRAKDPRYLLRLRNHFDLSGISDFNLGLSYLTADREELKIGAADFQYRWVPSTHKSFVFSGEYFQRMDEAFKNERQAAGKSYDDHMGYLLAGEYQWNNNWRAGASYSLFDSLEEEPNLWKSKTLWIANNKTEFSRYLLQYERREKEGAQKDDERWTLQFIFNTGYHRHKLK